MKHKIDIYDNWKFLKQEDEGIKFSEKKNIIPEEIIKCEEWEDINIPHDWDIKGPFKEEYKSGESGGYAPCGIGWYKRELPIFEIYKDNKIFLKFDGIYHKSKIWINGKFVQEWLYGYSPFDVDITDYVSFTQKNIITIRVNNSSQPSCRWYTGSGITRSALLIIKEKVYIPCGGVYVKCSMGNKKEINSSNIKISAEIRNDHSQPIKIRVKNSIYDEVDQKVPIWSDESTFFINENDIYTHNTGFKIEKPFLWELDSPHLYNITTELYYIDEEIPFSHRSSSFGIRDFAFNGFGFSLNNKHFKLKGVCLHHDGGCVGAAVPKDVWVRRIKKLKSIGCNSIRTSHNIPTKEFLEVCDEHGIIVIAEAFDKWMNPPRLGSWQVSPVFPFGKNFNKHWRQILNNFIRRDRNHPSIVLWSLGNELSRISHPKMKKWYIKLRDYVKTLDDTRPITTALSPHNTKLALKKTLKFKIDAKKAKNEPLIGDLMDVISINYTEAYAPEFHLNWPNKSIIIAEAYHYYRNLPDMLGDLFPDEKLIEPSELHPKCTSIMNPWYDVENHRYIAGQYLWAGIEYLGEVRDPYPYHGRTNAPIRITGFLKPQAGFHASVWKEEPYVHCAVVDNEADIPRGKPHFDFPKIVCHWNFEHRKEQPWEIWTFTNCDAVELMLNGKSLGINFAKNFPHNKMKWTIKYEPGTLIAIGKNFDSIEKDKLIKVAEYPLSTSGKPFKFVLSTDKTKMDADEKSCTHIEIELHDEDGILVQLEPTEFEISIKGPGKLLGLDNGDLSAHTELGEYQSPIDKTYWGQALAIIQSLVEPGTITVSIKALDGSKSIIGESIDIITN